MTSEQRVTPGRPTYTVIRRNVRPPFNRVGIAAFIIAIAAPALAILNGIGGGFDGLIVLRGLAVLALAVAIASLFIRNRRNVFGYLALGLSIAWLALFFILLQVLVAALGGLTF